MLSFFILTVIFGSALWGGLYPHLPLIEGNADFPLLTVLAAIFSGAMLFAKRTGWHERQKDIPYLPLFIYGLLLLGYSLFSPYARWSYLEFLKYAGGVLFLLLVARHFSSLKKDRRLFFLAAFAFAGDGIALLNLAGWVFRIPPDYFYGYNPSSGRLFGTMLYCNTAAVFLLPPLFIHLVFLTLAPRGGKRFAHGVGAALCMVNIVLSLSRGTELILCVLYFPLIFFLKKPRRWRLFGSIFIIQNVALLLLPFLLNLYYAKKIFLLCDMLFLYAWISSYLVLFVLPKAVGYMGKRGEEGEGNRQTAWLAGMIVIGLVIPFWKLPAIAPYNTPETAWVMERAEKWTPVYREGRLQSKDDSVNYRMETLRFAFKMFLDKPWTGFGPGIYPLAYLEYRTFSFPWNSPHALLLEQLIELGLVGFSFFCVLLFAFFRRLVQAIRFSKKYMSKILIFSIVALFGHACLDKDWQYFAMPLTLWLLLGLALADPLPKASLAAPVSGRKWSYLVLSLLGVMTLHLFMLAAGGACMQAAKVYARQNDYSKAVRWAERAGKLDGLNAGYFLKLAEFAEKNESALSPGKPIAKLWLDKALRLCPDCPAIYYELSRFYWMQNNDAAGLYYWSGLRKKDPWGEYRTFEPDYLESDNYWEYGNDMMNVYYWSELRKRDPLGIVGAFKGVGKNIFLY